ncbi:CocE/NonD family hydrolase [Streptomyces enissocaesilis]|uniref:CocE/NonD family hydrolase n=1 Tax=Streptomyces enissocaesilis TaxID=332589 RepID=A0ABN3XBH8_9ACTN
MALFASVVAGQGTVVSAAESGGGQAVGNVSQDGGTPSASGTTVVMRDGTRIAATVHVPAEAGPHPLIVMPGAWVSMPQDVLLDGKKQLAEAGYVVVAYDPRGFRRSGGAVDMAGPRDVADVSDVISWALAHTPADGRRVGLYASSYGAAVSLNAAAHDARVTAVAALCPWTDLFDAFVPGGTRAAPITAYQQAVGMLDGRMSPETRRAFENIASGRDLAEVRAWARARSAHTFTAALNTRRTPVFMAGEWNDPLVPAGQTGRLLDELSGPRQLWMNPGGHGDSSSREASLLHPETTVRAHATRWLDHFLLGRPNGADRLAPLLLRSRNSTALETYPSWKAMEGTPAAVRVRTLREGRDPRLLAGLDSAADSGPFPVAGLADSLGLPPTTALPLLTPPLAAIWHSDPLASQWSLRGSPRVRTRVTSTASRGTFVAYLYDVDALGVARLVSHAPYTFTGTRPGTAIDVDLRMPASAWDVVQGHRLALVIDGGDHRYTGVSPLGASMTFSAADTRLSVHTRTG